MYASQSSLPAAEDLEQAREPGEIQRRRVLVQGIVQGVGFRPFVYALARRYLLAGFVLNDSTGVTIEVEGSARHLGQFIETLCREAPPLARIDLLHTEPLSARGESDFAIVHSQAGTAPRHALISPDISVCDACLRELFDPADRRYRYPFINCTNCGPRFTIIQDVPYDREKTTMRVFPMCPACQREYEDPLDRRFHAQPNACPVCGPQLSFNVWHLLEGEQTSDVADPLVQTTLALAGGAVLAIKGLGGYHLACDALHDGAVRRLRQRKQREAKPFAVMVPDLATAMQICEVSLEEATLLQDRRRPIVLLQRKEDSLVSDEVAPGCDTLGVMLPYTPLHYLLLHDYANVLASAQPVVLVMTSGNLSEEPIVYRDEEVEARLATIADGVLSHNRAIHMRCDDSVARVTGQGPQLFRRSRGYAPEPLPFAWGRGVPLLACGAHLKNTFCLVKEKQAFLSHHIGDLENLETLLSFREGIAHFQQLFAIQPEVLAYDLHPEYLATKYALESAIPHKIGVQHHEAHIASVMAEYGLTEPLIGIAADGTGYGTDGTIWGGEIFVGDLRRFERRYHLATIPLPGGEQAVRQPWRVAAAYLARAYGDDFFDRALPFTRQLDRRKWHTLAQMIERGLNSPQTSSMGRLFDAVAALLGLRQSVLYEGQAAIELETLAARVAQKSWISQCEKAYPFVIEEKEGTLNVLPLIQALVNNMEQGLAVPLIAWRFHLSIARMLLEVCLRIRRQTGLHTVALSGGVFQNRLVLEMLTTYLEKEAFQVYINQRVPPNDGGLSLGQAAIAAARLVL
ncbi:MAG TPA: carbamoyltransferase HypF [Ktedonobacteraceae bacterium]